MLQRPVPPGPGRDEDPGQAEEDWLAWREAAEDQLDLDEESLESLTSYLLIVDFVESRTQRG